MGLLKQMNKQIMELISSDSKQFHYYEYIDKYGIETKCDPIPSYLKQLLTNVHIQQHECYKNAITCCRVLTSLGSDAEYCECNQLVAGIVPSHHAIVYLPKHDIYIDPTIEMLFGYESCTEYLVFKRFKYVEAEELLFKTQYYGEVFNQWFRDTHKHVEQVTS